jgi:hypothetical protein
MPRLRATRRIEMRAIEITAVLHATSRDAPLANPKRRLGDVQDANNRKLINPAVCLRGYLPPRPG